jgi:hypothetical protein
MPSVRVIPGVTSGATEGRCIDGYWAESVCNLRARARHNRDAPRTEPRRLRLHIKRSGHASKGAAANTSLGHSTP